MLSYLPYLGKELLRLYKEPPYKALLYVAWALQIVPKRGYQFGPAARQFVGRQQELPTLYGAALTDMRDFLKLRFRAKGYPQSEIGSSNITIERLASGDFPEPVQAGLPAQVIDYAISSLDLLSRQPQGHSDYVNIETAIVKLKDLLKATGESVFDTDSIWDHSQKESWNRIFRECAD